MRFDNTFLRDLPGDPMTANTRRQVRDACWSAVRPTPVAAPKLVAWSPEVAALLGLAAEPDPQWAADVFSGNVPVEGMAPWAQRYGGHQFGNWAGQLGDGRAISLGEAVGPDERRWELQLKGAGPTPYSRMGDGRAVLRSSIREFLCSEAMHHLGVPTTRALSLVTTGENVVRDMFYDGNARPEPGAIVCRVAPSFVRFGTFEILAAQQEHALLRRLGEHVVTRHFPDLGVPTTDPACWPALLAEVSRRTAEMVVHWMRVGFVHGVMNTDNMSVLGLTIDYGPYGWIDNYDADWTPNTTDAQGRRYRFGHQPHIALWNLVRFANALVPLVGEPGPFEEALTAYHRTLESGHRSMLGDKLGLSDLGEADTTMMDELWKTLSVVETDMTLFFRGLADLDPDVGDRSDEQVTACIAEAWYAPDAVSPAAQAAIAGWIRSYAARVRADAASPTERRERMNRTNPRYVLRNYLAQTAIKEAEAGDPSRIHRLLDVLRRPYDEQPEHAELAAKRPDWARHEPGCSMLSCSS